jgi:dipeptidyl aminopeptidase/acylaminoacyl peptidase
MSAPTCLRSDLSHTPLYEEVRLFWQHTRQPGRGLISDAADISTNGRQAAFAGTVAESLVGALPTRICLTELGKGETRMLTSGPNSDRMPKYSPAGKRLAFLSDRTEVGNFQLYLLDPLSGAVYPTPQVRGWVEYLRWSPDGRFILLGVAGHGADIAGVQGAVTSKTSLQSVPGWMPRVNVGQEDYQWRSAWIYEVASDTVRKVTRDGCNVWEAAWCGTESLAAIVSSDPAESAWYRATLQRLQLRMDQDTVAYVPRDQLGCLGCSPSGKWIAVVEAVCSDRCFVAGVVQLIDPATGTRRTPEIGGLDVTCLEWCSEERILVAGHRGLETAIGIYDLTLDTFHECWSSRDLSTAGFHATVAAIGSSGDCVLIGEGFRRAPEIARIEEGRYHTIQSFDLGYGSYAEAIASIECLRWVAPDGLEIEGWLIRPEGSAPFPLVMVIHGGPVWHWRPMWLGRQGAPYLLMLLRHGYALFMPNPRGSSGRGQAFARKVFGDPGGADASDLLAGLNALVGRGAADPDRLGVIGGSYGGFMTAWLITQDPRFAVAVALAPVTNHLTEHLLSNVSACMALLLDDHYRNTAGRYFTRSPVMFAHRAKTPTLSICGALDRCTPPEEAMQFHQALLENGVRSVLALYPEEGHGVRQLPAVIDYAARVVGWFDHHMGPGVPSHFSGARPPLAAFE